MQVYLVGGAVRDMQLGKEPKDRDYVVVGASPQQMLAQGYISVGADFPVFLHPQTKEEYALARQERKSAPGHKGFETRFSPDVTLEQDLLRRDLSVNAMAYDEASKTLIDPYGGLQDLRAGVLRHVSDAFSEDPLRALRLARFAATLRFSIHPATLSLCQRLCAQGALNELPGERLGQEITKMSACQSREGLLIGWDALRHMGAIEAIDPAWERSNTLTRAILSALPEAPIAETALCALILNPEEARVDALADTLRLPNPIRDNAQRAQRLAKELGEPQGGTPAERALSLIETGGLHKLDEPLRERARALSLALLSAQGVEPERIAQAQDAFDQAIALSPAYRSAPIATALRASPKERPADVARATRLAALNEAMAPAPSASRAPRP